MPSICDPGEELVKSVMIKGIKIICIPGPSAVLTALVSSGMPSSKFIFEGFLPKKKSERKKVLLEIHKNSSLQLKFFFSNQKNFVRLNFLRQHSFHLQHRQVKLHILQNTLLCRQPNILDLHHLYQD